MVGNEAWTTDWRDGSAYAALLLADRSIIAWEWLRRDAAYRHAALRASGREGSGGAASPEHWGLHAFEDPDRAAPAARPLWSASLYPAVLAATAAAAPSVADAFDLERLGGLATLIRSEAGAEHVLLTDGLRTIRLDVLEGSISSSPVELRYLIAGLGSAELPLLTLRRLIALCRTGRFSRSLHPPEAKARRWLLMLRAHDALAAGAGQREIAAELLSRTAREARWRSEAPSLRSQAQRLVRGARLLVRGGWRTLLR